MTEVPAIGSVYAIGGDSGHVKIGMTLRGTARDRLRDLQTGSYQPLRLLAECAEANPAEVEAHLHGCLRALGVGLSGEWFAPSIHTTVIVALMGADCLQEAVQYAMDWWCWQDIGGSWDFEGWRAARGIVLKV